MGDSSVVIKFLYQRLKTWLTDTKLMYATSCKNLLDCVQYILVYILLNMFGGCLIWQVKF